jgi:hypothetical protein
LSDTRQLAVPDQPLACRREAAILRINEIVKALHRTAA